ncbi:hypothetical protein BV22DRAFT_1036875 [Leucogyrophana mollusca]|uniref:Uncharacterized protein n=1 Tax=Leucogyrophana mollusca TaxID=85980 RepID=A0ACB8BCS8_9AGAM|nr:hypothetical protein BV22DRAFT_1036875 [Leucogyrophana mollusca]
MESRASTRFSGGHSDDVDYESWNPTHPELFCTSSQKDRCSLLGRARQLSRVQRLEWYVFAPDNVVPWHRFG